MPYGPLMGLFLPIGCDPDPNKYPEEWYIDVGESLANKVADDDGMAQPYIRLEGIKTPRALSWAEERALRHDLAEGALSILNGEWFRSRTWRRL